MKIDLEIWQMFFPHRHYPKQNHKKQEQLLLYDVKYMLKSLKDHFILECWLCHLKLVKWVFMNLASRVKLNQRRFWTQDKMHY